MNRILAALVLATPLLLAACSSQKAAPQQAYSNTEIKKFALDMLGASSMSRGNYNRYKRALSERGAN